MLLKNSFIIAFTFAGMLLLMTVFATDMSLAKGLVMGKVFWFHRAMVVFLLSACYLS